MLDNLIFMEFPHQGPVVKSIISLTKSVVEDSLSLPVHMESLVLTFFVEKLSGAFASCKSSIHFSAKKGSVFAYNRLENLTSP